MGARRENKQYNRVSSGRTTRACILMISVSRTQKRLESTVRSHWFHMFTAILNVLSAGGLYGAVWPSCNDKIAP